MQSQSQNTQFYPEVQTNYQTVLEKVAELYLKFIPDIIRLRRNTDQQKQPDTVIISTIIWGLMMGFPSQSDTYRAICAFLYASSDFVSRSSYSRLCANLKGGSLKHTNDIIQIQLHDQSRTALDQNTYTQEG